MSNATLSAPVRFITAAAESFGSANAYKFYHYGDLVSLQVDRIGEGKFFGFGVCQKANIKIRDKGRNYSFTTDNYFNITFDNIENCLPYFYVTEVNRDEKTNQLSITAYDLLYKATKHTVSELGITSYKLSDFVAQCAAFLGSNGYSVSGNGFNAAYDTGANLNGTETIREALDDIAEVTNTIYYLDKDNMLKFRPLTTQDKEPFSINKELYFELDSKTNRRLSAVCSATELGDNLTATLDYTGSTQYIRDNAFLDLREDRAQVIEDILAEVGGLTINQFDCEWRGNYLLEIGDKLALETKDGEIAYSYLINDTIKYNGAYNQTTNWQYSGDEETESNATTLGDIIKNTYAKVDKQEQQISLVVNDINATAESISNLQLNTDSINASVTNLTNALNDSMGAVNESLETLTNKVNATMTAEEIKVEVAQQVVNGVNSVETSTGFTFNEKGLTVSKSESDFSTTITEDGMQIKKDNTEVLSASNEGVKAIDLHATTFLLIGTNSRFEDFGSNRTGCFWIGG